MTIDFNDNTYKPIVLDTTQSANVKSVISDFIDSTCTQCSHVYKLENKLVYVVDHVMKNLPEGIERVDGNSIRPILKETVNEKIELYLSSSMSGSQEE